VGCGHDWLLCVQCLLARISGLGVRGGAQCLGHAVRAGILPHPEDVTLQLDCKNAFNSLCSTTMLRAVAERAPQLSRFALWMYKHAGQLWLPEASPDLQTEDRYGEDQGCGKGTLLGLSSSPSPYNVSSREVQCSHPDIKLIAFLDDVVLQGPCSGVVAAYEAIKSQFKEQGFVVQRTRAKCTPPPSPMQSTSPRAMA
jgi:hypothetical protein